MVTHSFTTIIQEQPLLTLAQAKKQCKVGDDLIYEDDLIADYNFAAQVSAENFINRAIAQRDFVMQCDKFESIIFEANYENDVIAKVEYYAPGESELTLLSDASYKLRNATVIDCLQITFINVPAVDERQDAIIVTIEQGFTAETCPKPILQAIRLRLSSSYVYREDSGGNNVASNNLLRAYRKY